MRPLKHLSKHPTQREKIEALHQFISLLPHEIPGDVIFPLLEDPSSQVRTLATQALTKAKHPALLGHLIALLQDKDSHVRNQGVLHLRSLRNRAATVPLIECLKDPHSTVRSNAAITIMLFGKEAVHLAKEHLPKFSRHDQVGVMRAFANLSKAGEEVLEAGLQTDDPWVQCEAAKALNSKKSEKSTLILLAALKNPHPLIRLEAVRALKNHVHPAIQQAVQTLRFDPHPPVAEAASALLYQFSEVKSRTQQFIKRKTPN